MENFAKFCVRMRRLGFNFKRNDEDYQVLDCGDKGFYLRFEDKIIGNSLSLELLKTRENKHRQVMLAIGRKSKKKKTLDLDKKHFLGTADVAYMIGISRTNVDWLIKSGSIPQPTKVGKLNKWHKDLILPLVDDLRERAVKRGYKYV